MGARRSTSACPSTTTRAPWTGWTSTALCVEREPSLTSPPYMQLPRFCLPLRGEPEPVWCCRVWKDRGVLLSIVQRARLLVLVLLVLVRTTEHSATLLVLVRT